jgi:hypothetical protein
MRNNRVRVHYNLDEVGMKMSQSGHLDNTRLIMEYYSGFVVGILSRVFLCTSIFLRIYCFNFHLIRQTKSNLNRSVTTRYEQQLKGGVLQGIKFAIQWVHYTPRQLCGLCISIPLAGIFGILQSFKIFLVPEESVSMAAMIESSRAWKGKNFSNNKEQQVCGSVFTSYRIQLWRTANKGRHFGTGLQSTTIAIGQSCWGPQ